MRPSSVPSEYTSTVQFGQAVPEADPAAVMTGGGRRAFPPLMFSIALPTFEWSAFAGMGLGGVPHPAAAPAAPAVKGDKVWRAAASRCQADVVKIGGGLQQDAIQ